MADSHLKIFQGQNIDLIVESKSKFDEFVYFHLLEKSEKETERKVTLSFILEDVAMILCLLRKKIYIWESYREQDLKVSFVWEDKNCQRLWIHLANHSKILYISQIEVLKLLIRHLLNEKVIYATSKKIIDSNLNFKEMLNKNIMMESIDKVEGKIISETEKAILIKLMNNVDVWIPKSSIHSKYSPKNLSFQSFIIENWVLKKNDLEHPMIDFHRSKS